MPVDRQAAASAIRTADARWSKTTAANDLNGTVSFYGDEAFLLAPNEPIATDQKAIRASWASLLGPGVSLSWQVSKAEVAQSGELGYLVGSYRLIAKDAHGDPANEQGKFVEVWKKQVDGAEVRRGHE
jgi:ketosteroid isomerase-like protein